MTCFELVGDRGGYIIERKQSGFLRHARVEYDLKQKIPEFAAQVVHITTRYRVSHFIGLFDGVRRDRGEVLLAIPFTTAHRIAQLLHDRKQPVERGD